MGDAGDYGRDCATFPWRLPSAGVSGETIRAAKILMTADPGARPDWRRRPARVCGRWLAGSMDRGG